MSPAAPLDAAAARAILDPGPELEQRIKAFIDDQLGGVLPRDPGRGRDRYYDAVVLGARALDAHRVLARELPVPDGPVLDVGSGLGSFVLVSNAVGRAAIGVEPGGAELELARERAARLGQPRDAFREGVGEQLPAADGEMAGVLLQDALEHVPDWRATLREAVRVLRPGGSLYVKGPSYAVRFFEPHYRLPWVPLLPRPLARRYLGATGRDPAYLEHVGYRRRGAVLRELRALGLELDFPRTWRVADPALVNRRAVRGVVAIANRAGPPGRALLRALADNPFQSTIDVVGRKPAESG